MPIEINGADEATVGPIRDALRAAPKLSPSFTGTPTAPTPSAGDNSTKIATTAFVLSEIASSGGGGGSGDMIAANNLSDLTNVATARNNLGLGNVDNTSNATERAAARTLTNATLGTGTTINTATITLGSDATGDIYYRNSSGFLVRLPIGSTGQVLTVTGGLPSWAATGGGGGTGDVVGPASASDNAIARFDSTTGKLLQNSGVTITDNGTVNLVATAASYASANLPHGTAPTSPANGDIWTTTAGFFARINGATVGPFGSGGLANFTESVSTSAPNSTIPVVRLLATNAATNVDAVLSPKGSGALLAQTPDNTSSGGNKRGVNAVDLQTIRSAPDQVASGNQSVITGGHSNTASSPFSRAGGYGSSTRGIRGADVYSTGPYAAVGDMQMSSNQLKIQTTDATTTELSIDGSSPAASTRIILPNNSTYNFTGKVVARTAAGVSKVFNFRGGIKRGANAAATALVGMVTITDAFDAAAMGWALSIDADTTNGALRFQVTGAAATTIRWLATVETAEIVF